MIEVGLIGCGAVVHSNYAETLVARSEYRVGCVCDTNPAQAQSAAALFGAEVLPLEGLLERADAVVISTPPATHAALVRASLRPGRVILCEKPFMTTYRDALELTEAARTCDGHLYVGQFRRLFPQVILARELVALGVLGEVIGLSASEGGRFTWNAVSNYTTRDPTGGVLWDTGAHTLDMALYAARVEHSDQLDVRDIRVERDKPEPSHDFRASFSMSTGGVPIEGRVHLSRREALPNMVTVKGDRGHLTFITGLDQRVRLTTPTGTTVLCATEAYGELMECFELQVRRILLSDGAEPFAAENFIGHIKLLEALSNA